MKENYKVFSTNNVPNDVGVLVFESKDYIEATVEFSKLKSGFIVKETCEILDNKKNHLKSQPDSKIENNIAK